MKLQPGIHGINFITYALVYFVTNIAIAIIYSFVVFILSDPNYYDIDKDNIGPVIS